jgi:hypothetical protein
MFRNIGVTAQKVGEPMLPIELKTLVEKQPGQVQRKNRAAAELALSNLKVPLDSELAQFFLAYTITLFQSVVSSEQLCDIADPTHEIAVGTRYIREVWELPEQFVCLSSVQGEGAYLYDLNVGSVWDFELGARDAFLTGRQSARWQGFYEFMIWYLGGSK